jgi:hypothetical protein
MSYSGATRSLHWIIGFVLSAEQLPARKQKGLSHTREMKWVEKNAQERKESATVK